MNHLEKSRSMPVMRILSLILILAISAQPLQAGFCAIDIGQGSSADMASQMDMSDSDDHSCCDPEESESDTGCEAGMHCGMCTAAVPLVPEIPRIASILNSSHVSMLEGGHLLPSHSSPPYRPPIS